ncbi:unnamed protein product [Peniophora sp. CBMAI 1063]|nr:unnamed protein product [Peniophora sp. CBMAI 1063]
MAKAVDPTYPLYPLASILAAAMIVLVFLTSLIRQSWNLGVALLCFWLFFENLTNGINTIIWADNADVKFYVYCDIVTHLQVVVTVVKPMATLIITRRLYLIASQSPLGLDEDRARCKNAIIEWILGLAVPVVVAGPIYYIVQQYRFAVHEGYGCENSVDGSILSFLLIWSWNVIPPLISIIIYYPRVASLFFHNGRRINRLLSSNNSISYINYLRIFAFASLDVLLTLPIGIVSVILTAIAESSQDWVFYRGWAFDHKNWGPVSVPYEIQVAAGSSALAQRYFAQWTSPVLAFALFGLFGVTSEARASYWRVLYRAGSWFVWRPDPPNVCGGDSRPLGDVDSRVPPLDTLVDSADLRSGASYTNSQARQPVAESEQGRDPATCTLQNSISGDPTYHDHGLTT